MSGGKGNGLWSKISNGAKKLFNKARDTVKKYSPKFRTGTEGTVDLSRCSTRWRNSTPMTIDANKLQNI